MKNNIVYHGSGNYIDKKISMSIYFTITELCNFKCPYCNVCVKKEKTNIKKLKKIIDFIFNLPKNNIKLIISGGEPTIHPNFFEIIEYINTKNKENNKLKILSIFTNFSKSVDFYKKIDKIMNNINVEIFPSFHKEFIDIDEFCKKYLDLSSYKKFLTNPAFMLHNESCKELFYETIKKYPSIPFIMSPINGLKIKDDINYPSKFLLQNQLSILYSNNKYYYIQGKRPENKNFKWCICNSFKNNMMISADGIIYRCMTSMVSNANNLPKLSVFDKNINDKLTDQCVCLQKECICGFSTPRVHKDHQFLLKLSHNEMMEKFEEWKI